MISLLLTLFISLFSICSSYNKVEDRKENDITINEHKNVNYLYSSNINSSSPNSDLLHFYTADFAPYISSWYNDVNFGNYVISPNDGSLIPNGSCPIKDLAVVPFPSGTITNGYFTQYYSSDNAVVIADRVRIALSSQVFDSFNSFADIDTFESFPYLNNNSRSLRLCAFNLGYQADSIFTFNNSLYHCPAGNYVALAFMYLSFSPTSTPQYSLISAYFTLYCISNNTFNYPDISCNTIFSCLRNYDSFVFCFNDTGNTGLTNSTRAFDINNNSYYKLGSAVSDSRYEEGYNKGYDTGYGKGYDTGYDTGNADGYQFGYDEGYEEGTDIDATASTIFTGILDVALIPVNVFLTIFNFEVFGINIAGIVSALLTISVVVIIIRFVTGKKDD